jgi:hypothetical protein
MPAVVPGPSRFRTQKGVARWPVERQCLTDRTAAPRPHRRHRRPTPAVTTRRTVAWSGISV